VRIRITYRGAQKDPVQLRHLADLWKNLLGLYQRNISVVLNNLDPEYILTKIQPLTRYTRGSIPAATLHSRR